MTDYKHTLNLPGTDFPMKANLAQREPNLLDFWSKIGLYDQMAAQASAQARPRFVLHDGPPYANGDIHLGTSLNKVLKDIIIKAKRLSGFDAPFVPGWDCHGLPIELHVEKKIGKAGLKVSPRDFRAACRDFARSQVEAQKADFERLGVLADWAHPYLTLDRRYEANAIRALAAIVGQGHLHRGQKPVHWCLPCGSALAEAEVTYQDKTSLAIDVAFLLTAADQASLLAQHGLDVACEAVVFPIWTTTPWTLPANEAVCLHPSLPYAVVKAAIGSAPARLYVIAEAQVTEVMSRYGFAAYEVVRTMPGEAFAGWVLQHPFLAHQVPVVLGEHVSDESGTGCVHTAPCHGQEDYEVGLAAQLPMRHVVDSRGCYLDTLPRLGGVHIEKATTIIVDWLVETNTLLHQVDYPHSYPHCWRHNKPLIFLATSQWFVAMDQAGLREMALTGIESVEWIPAWGQRRIHNMIETRPDWCISRQRTWGIPLPLFVHKTTQQLHPETIALLNQVAECVEAEGIDAWFESSPRDFLGAEADEYEVVRDTLDVWFDSGVSQYCVLNDREELSGPADLYLEGSDQHRGWFQTSLLTRLAIQQQVPFDAVLTHGYVVDGKGYKMSKSVGNVISPKTVVKQYGADVLRLWVASSDCTQDITVSDAILKQAADAYRRLRNTARFLLSNLDDFDFTTHAVSADNLLALDRFVINRVMTLQTEITAAYDAYRVQSVYQLIHQFCTKEMGGFYLDVIKDRLYTCAADSLPRRSAQTALFIILSALVRWIAPIISFTAEEIWQHMPGEQEVDSVFLSTWFAEFPAVTEGSDGLDWPLLLGIREQVNKAIELERAEGKIGSALDASLEIKARPSDYAVLSLLGEELRFFFMTAAVRCVVSESATPYVPEITVTPVSDPKCARCWQRDAKVNAHADYPDICPRCVVNLSGEGEVRVYV